MAGIDLLEACDVTGDVLDAPRGPEPGSRAALCGLMAGGAFLAPADRFSDMMERNAPRWAGMPAVAAGSLAGYGRGRTAD